jgi:hypothetical protein
VLVPQPLLGRGVQRRVQNQEYSLLAKDVMNDQADHKSQRWYRDIELFVVLGHCVLLVLFVIRITLFDETQESDQFSELFSFRYMKGLKR